MQLSSETQKLYASVCAPPSGGGAAPPSQSAPHASPPSGGKPQAGGQRGGSDSRGSDSLHFGFVPGRLISDLQDQLNWRVRALAIEELQHVIRSLPTHVCVRVNNAHLSVRQQHALECACPHDGRG